MKVPTACSIDMKVNSTTAPQAFQRSAPCSFTPSMKVPGSPASARVPPTCNVNFNASYGGDALCTTVNSA